ncbi:MAG TPA: hypothetical protein VEG66_07080 [Thermoplasmata archaeon]|nr:hypothetical protein [Thermoplasmata archaeon]
MSTNQRPNALTRPRGPILPPPGSRGGLALIGAIFFGVVYLIVLVSQYSALSAEAPWVVGLNLVISVIVTFFLVSMIASDRARAADFELEFARTVQAHLAAEETLVQSSPLGGILSEYARVAHEQRRAAREHTYAAGPAIYSAGFATLAACLVGLAYAIGADANTLGVAMLVELGGFFFLVLATAILVLSVGRGADVPEFHALVPRRWAKVTEPSFPFTYSLGEVPWAAQAPVPVNPPLWQESGGMSPARS